MNLETANLDILIIWMGYIILYKGVSYVKRKSYKEAEEQGLLVRLPCPVGTTVWDICGMDIRENVVCGIECGKNGKQFLWANHDEWLGELNDLVFLTREAAEKKLEEF